MFKLETARFAFSSLFVLAAASVAAPSAQAHHSTASFDMSRTVVVEGTVTRFEWSNPHVYVFVAQTTDAGDTVDWAVEAHAPALLRRMGWSNDTLAPGDVVVVTGNPSRRASRKSLFLGSMSRAGVTIYDGRGFMAGLASASDAAPSPASGLEGTWSTLLSGVANQLISPASSLSLTDAGAAAVAGYDETTMNSAAGCVALPAPAFMFIPDVKTIASGDGVITIRGEYDGAERVIHLDAASHDGAAPTVQGHSIGRWEGETLVIDTAAFTPLPDGNGMGLPSSAQRHLVERLTLDSDKTGLTYAFELSDPPYLAEPARGAVQWVYSPDAEPSGGEACTLENARRYIDG